MSSFHGTAASLHQKGNRFSTGSRCNRKLSNETHLKKLPDEYQEIPPCFITEAKAGPEFEAKPPQTNYIDVYQSENDWLSSVQEASQTDDIDCKSWSVFNSAKCTPVNQSDTSGLFPMCRESSKSPAMIKHSIDVVSKAIKHLNPSQTPVVAFDQPLFAIAKSLQWAIAN